MSGIGILIRERTNPPEASLHIPHLHHEPPLANLIVFFHEVITSELSGR